MLHSFLLKEEKVRLWQNSGESFEHILMKALGYVMFIEKYPNLEIEKRVGLRYKPDLIARKGKRVFDFWGECGQNSIKKTGWLLKHTKIKEFALFKIGFNCEALIKQIRKEIPRKYRPRKKVILINFNREIKKLTVDKKIRKVEKDWYQQFEV